MRYKILVKEQILVVNIRTCNKCKNIGVTLSKRRGICFDCMKQGKKSSERIPKVLRKFTCAEIIAKIRVGEFPKFCLKRVGKRHKWDIIE